jgi:hypothetical protein
VPPAGWAHVVATFDGADAGIYVNGVAGTAAPVAPAVNPPTTAPLGLGYLPGVPYPCSFWGGLDEFAFYDKVLTPAHVQAHYNAGKSARQGGKQVAVKETHGPHPNPDRVQKSTPKKSPSTKAKKAD